MMPYPKLMVIHLHQCELGFFTIFIGCMHETQGNGEKIRVALLQTILIPKTFLKLTA